MESVGRLKVEFGDVDDMASKMGSSKAILARRSSALVSRSTGTGTTNRILKVSGASVVRNRSNIDNVTYGSS